MVYNNISTTCPVRGAGLGLRRVMLDSLQNQIPDTINFFEVAPENWMTLGGKHARQFRAVTERHPFVTHGLSLSIGSPTPLDIELVKNIRDFLNTHGIQYYSEHLTYCSDDGHLYDLMPIPFTEKAVDYVAQRILQAQEILGRRIAMENASYYTHAPGKEMEEIDFILAVLEKADCGLLLDINNIYVNSINHGYDAQTFLNAMPADRVGYFHIAGHYNEADDLIIDSHGADVIDPVWELLDKAYNRFGLVPTLLERDFNIPPLEVLLTEVDRIHAAQEQHLQNNTSAGCM
ncbi:MAG: hypothetical protein AMJ55_03740 [Gammaproteobacteria bacterium SG8_15]|nr:MAG: hypothetical protein AMJ55_03740 [Gammaproteobacteria bacterium SG8_15]